MNVLFSERTAFSRQIREATVIMIEERRSPGTLNRKQEYNGCLVPSLGINNWGSNNNHMKKNMSVEEKSKIEDPDKRYNYEEEERSSNNMKPRNYKRRNINNNKSSKQMSDSNQNQSRITKFLMLKRQEEPNDINNQT